MFLSSFSIARLLGYRSVEDGGGGEKEGGVRIDTSLS